MAQLHQVTFEWPHSKPNTVVVTGSFDQWSCSTKLSKDSSSFKGTVQVPWNHKVLYKFVVDGQWLINDREPTEYDSSGNINNVYHSPDKPPVPSAAPVEEPSSHINGIVDEKVEEKAEEEPPKVSDVAKTIIAADGTTSAAEYVVSGIGAAIQGVIGVDPINANKIPVETPKTETEPVEHSEPSPAEVSVGAPPVEPLVPVIEAAKPTPGAASSTVNGHANGEALSTASTNIIAAANLPSEASNQVTAPLEPSTHTPATTVVPAAAAAEPTTTADVGGTPTTSAIPSAQPAAAPAPSSEAKPTASDAQPTQTDKTSPGSPKINGNGKTTESVNGKASEGAPSEASRSSSPAPSTPTKKNKHRRFPSFAGKDPESPGSDTSPSSSRFRTTSSSGSIRKSLAGLKRVSLRNIFSGKDKDEKEK